MLIFLSSNVDIQVCSLVNLRTHYLSRVLMGKEILYNLTLDSYQFIGRLVINDYLLLFFSELMNTIVYKSLNKILTAKGRISVHALHLEELLLNGDHSYV
jgi:hypothetical protein